MPSLTLPPVRIEKMIPGGKSLARHDDGRAIIVSGMGAFPGALVELSVTRAKKSHIEGSVRAVVEPSPMVRILEDGEEIFGGCPWLTLPYQSQLDIKSSTVREALWRSVEGALWHSIVSSPLQKRYRNKVEWSYGTYISAREGVHDRYRFGFHAPAAYDRIIDMHDCILASESMNQIFRQVDALSRSSGILTYDPHTHSGVFRHLILRENLSGEIMLALSIKSNDSLCTEETLESIRTLIHSVCGEFAQIVSAQIIHNTGLADIVAGECEVISGSSTLVQTLLGKEFLLRPLSFFQVNTLAAERLYQSAADLIRTRGGVLLDLYAGTSTIGICLAEHFDQVISVELSESAHSDALENIARNHLSAKITARCEWVEHFVKDFQRDLSRPLTIIVDPPREGLRPDATDLLPTFGADEIIYISCNPTTMARDIMLMAEKGYSPTDVIPVDMFPQTHHSEAVVRLELTKEIWGL